MVTSRDTLNFGGPIHISRMAEARAEARALKFCTKGDFTKSCERDDKSPLKGRGFAHVTHFCMHNCGVRKNYPRPPVNCAQQCSRRRTTAYSTNGARGHTKA